MKSLAFFSLLVLSTFLLGNCDDLIAKDDSQLCQDQIVGCLKTYFGDHDKSKLKSCVVASFEEYGASVCMPCLKSENLLINTSFAFDLVFTMPLVDFAVNTDCVADCYHTYLNTCNEHEYAQCASKCAPKVENFLEAIGIKPHDEDPTEECQDAAIDCLSEFFENNNQTQLDSCFKKTYMKYGTKTCMPCFNQKALFMTEEFHLAPSADVDISSADKICVEDCYRDYMNDCSVSNYKKCAFGCVSPHADELIATSKTEQCQSALLGCLDTFFDNQNESQLKHCFYSQYAKYGSEVCMPCLSGETFMTENYVKPTHNNGLTPQEKECELKCFGHYLNDCNRAMESQCSSGCSLRIQDPPQFLE